MELKKNIFGKYKTSELRIEKISIYILCFIAIIITLYFFLKMDMKWEMFNLEILKEIVNGFLGLFSVEKEVWLVLIKGIIVSIAMTFIVTVIGGTLGIIFSFFASKNLVRQSIATFTKSLAGIARAVPTIVWVIIFIPAFGLSPTTAIVGMTFHTVAFFVKALSESFEELDDGIIEALKATGANRIKIFFSAALPASFKRIVSWFALRFEQNLGVAIVIGPAIGVPGSIGTYVNQYVRGRQWDLTAASIVVIFVVAYSIEIVVSRMQRDVNND